MYVKFLTKNFLVDTVCRYKGGGSNYLSCNGYRTSEKTLEKIGVEGEGWSLR